MNKEFSSKKKWLVKRRQDCLDRIETIQGLASDEWRRLTHEEREEQAGLEHRIFLFDRLIKNVKKQDEERKAAIQREPQFRGDKEYSPYFDQKREIAPPDVSDLVHEVDLISETPVHLLASSVSTQAEALLSWNYRHLQSKHTHRSRRWENFTRG